MQRGGGIFFLRRLFSAMSPKPVFPSPPSEGGLLRDEEVIRDEIHGAVAKGGSHDIAAIVARLGLAWCA